MTARGLAADSFGVALRLETERGYVLGLPRQALVPCRESAAWPPRASVVPLVDTRPYALLRRGAPALAVEWDAAVRPAEAGDTAQAVPVSFRARLFLALALAALLPLSALAFGVRREMTRRLTAENARRGDAAVAALRDDLARESAAVAARLATLAAELGRDNGLRLALVQGDAGARRGLLDLAGSAMRSSGLAMLQLQDSAGRILSSGHFRNAYDRVEPALPDALVAAGTAPVLVRARTADTTLLVLARLDSLRVAGARYTVIGGTAIEPRLRGSLARDPDLSLRLVEPGRRRPSGRRRRPKPGPLRWRRSRCRSSTSAPRRGAIVAGDTARLVVTRSPGTLAALRRSIDRWFLAALAATVRPRDPRRLVALDPREPPADASSPRGPPRSTSTALDQSFSSDRTDEIGALSPPRSAR